MRYCVARESGEELAELPELLADESDESDELLELAEKEHPSGSSSAATRNAPSKRSNDNLAIP